MKILLISNMYPSEKDKTYGTFVKMFKEGIEHNMNDIVFDCCFIRGRSNSSVSYTHLTLPTTPYV